VRLAAATAARLDLACEVFLSRLAPLDGLENEHNGIEAGFGREWPQGSGLSRCTGR
jgi:hypothetical protein